MVKRSGSSEEFGVDLFKNMYEIAPTAWGVFPWGNGDTHKDDFFKDPKFLKFARNFIGMLDMAIDMLGPDLDLVEEQLQHLGVNHIDYGVEPRHYPL